MGKDKFNKDEMPFNNRELSWIGFNERVLDEAMNESNPIMERAHFLSITASNLDEFFMVRVAGVMDKKIDKPKNKDVSGFKPKKLLNALTIKIHKFYDKQYDCFFNQIVPSFEENDIHFLKWDQLSLEQMDYVEQYFEKTIFPVLTPMAVDTGRPFPFLSNRSLNIAVELRKDNDLLFGIVQVPSILPRYCLIPSMSGKTYMFLEDIITGKLPRLFEFYNVHSSCTFRITRDSDLEINSEAKNLLTEVENSIKMRVRGDVVRLEIGNRKNKDIKKFLVSTLNVGKKEIYEVDGPIDLSFLAKFYSEQDEKKLKFKPLEQVNPPYDFVGCNDIFQAIREKDRMVCHPFESFDWVTKFVESAAEDKNVLAIKQVLYRVSGNSPIIDALIRAAENGKQVTVLVELRARFDEENNISWAKKLEKAGCHVIYGLADLKTHCKVILVVRKEDNCIRRYIHMGTGNYNDKTAKIYTDVGVFTCKNEYGSDASLLFNSITGYFSNAKYQKMIVAPRYMREFFEKMIKNETKNASKGIKSRIIIKVNSLVDKKLIKELYRASNAGVKIQLIVRGVCSLVPGLRGYSENIKVRSIVGRFLEHSRIFYFENAGKPKIYMGSADLMPRNLDRRVEVVFPIDSHDLRKRTVKIINMLLKDTRNAKMQDKKGFYHSVKKNGKNAFDSQAKLFELFEPKSKSEERFGNNVTTFKLLNRKDLEGVL